MLTFEGPDASSHNPGKNVACRCVYPLDGQTALEIVAFPPRPSLWERAPVQTPLYLFILIYFPSLCLRQIRNEKHGPLRTPLPGSHEQGMPLFSFCPGADNMLVVGNVSPWLSSRRQADAACFTGNCVRWESVLFLCSSLVCFPPREIAPRHTLAE